MRILFFGTPQFSADILASLIADDAFTIVGVVCQQDELLGRKKVLTPPPTKLLAIQYNIPVFQPTKLKDEQFLSSIDALNADIAVIVAYGRILPQVLLSKIPKGFINLHPSLLPKYRGPSPMQSAILNGDSQTGVTIMKIDEGMDTGPILAQIPITLDETETTESLTSKVVAVGAPLLVAALKGYSDGSITPRDQSTEGISICTLLTKEDGKIDWTQSAKLIDQKIRAFTPWPGTWTIWNINNQDIQVKIIKASPTSPQSTNPIGVPYLFEGQLLVNAGSNTAPVISELQPSGKNSMSGDAFVRGYLRSL